MKHNMIAGEPLLSHYVAGLGIESFSDLLREGERAVTLEIDNLNSASGMALPGDIVDLLLVTEKVVEDSEELADEPLKQIEPLLQKVRILSVDNISLVSQTQDFKMYGYEKDFLEYSTITVGINFKDAAKVILAKELGEIVFMLRNSSDKTKVSNRAITSDFKQGRIKNSSRSYKLYTSSKISNGEIKPITVNVISGQQSRLSRSVAVYSNQ
ncbi:Flp pilus assembly protein CpaB [Shewanella sp. CAL98-MNA-CIBAN-0140]|uniref:Flp pilus assembly protein CpaB n=1 Tax=Shewanella sp. CAL98-MNA-CIBAN-0140 TaxID=3140462 RepID=UPI00331BFF7E